MLTRGQIILLQKARQQCAFDDQDYRDALETVSAIPGCRSSKDDRLTDRHLDLLMAYFEAIYWRKFDAGEIVLEPVADRQVFRERNFWASKNPNGNTSRDRFTQGDLADRIRSLEAELSQIGFGPGYIHAIRRRIHHDRAYHAALARTLASKRKKKSSLSAPTEVVGGPLDGMVIGGGSPEEDNVPF